MRRDGRLRGQPDSERRDDPEDDTDGGRVRHRQTSQGNGSGGDPPQPPLPWDAPVAASLQEPGQKARNGCQCHDVGPHAGRQLEPQGEGRKQERRRDRPEPGARILGEQALAQDGDTGDPHQRCHEKQGVARHQGVLGAEVDQRAQRVPDVGVVGASVAQAEQPLVGRHRVGVSGARHQPDLVVVVGGVPALHDETRSHGADDRQDRHQPGCYDTQKLGQHLLGPLPDPLHPPRTRAPRDRPAQCRDTRQEQEHGGVAVPAPDHTEVVHEHAGEPHEGEGPCRCGHDPDHERSGIEDRCQEVAGAVEQRHQ